MLFFLIFFLGSDLAGAFVLLHEAETKLKRLVHDKFEAAIQNGDRNSVERCLFNMNIIIIYTLCSGIQEKTQVSHYFDALIGAIQKIWGCLSKNVNVIIHNIVEYKICFWI